MISLAQDGVTAVKVTQMICGGLDQDKETKRRVQQEEQFRGTYAALMGSEVQAG